LPEPPAERRRRLQADWGFTDLEFRDVVNGGALDAVADTVAAGCPPQAARKWWTAELARRANEAGVDLAALGVTPTQVARVQALIDEGTLTDSLARKVFDYLLAGESDPDAIVAAHSLAVVSDEGAL
ncbi:MAG TPA: Asp-tRNA(Asn)/Glu-tRNA(Gln) amidotransferase GatCAB subunit B, partial [Propionibacteriaceae bacterium]|nr:Asp-tRNA(Asn)/Glu-tRNA(Gln) amidotransferase GatCAB subunit B [Propionibacteriaceae bacterium]